MNTLVLSADVVAALGEGGATSFGPSQAMLARLAFADRASGEVVVRKVGRAVASGVAYSEDPREDRVEDLHVDVWASDVAGDGPVTRYRMAREAVGAERAVTVERDVGAAVVLSSAGLRSVVAALRSAEAVLEEAIAL